MRKLISAAATFLLATASAQAQTLTSDQTAIAQAAYFFAIGAIAYGECPKLSYKVNPNGWHALVEHTAPGVAEADFIKGGKYEALSREVFKYTGQIIDEAGKPAWCAYIAAWTKAYHPQVWPNLIVKP
jgi:hypothetical protein